MWDITLLPSFPIPTGDPIPPCFPSSKSTVPQLILHAGDVGGTELLEELEKISTTIYIRGNVDPTGPTWPDYSVSSHRVRFGKHSICCSYISPWHI